MRTAVTAALLKRTADSQQKTLALNKFPSVFKCIQAVTNLANLAKVAQIWDKIQDSVALPHGPEPNPQNPALGITQTNLHFSIVKLSDKLQKEEEEEEESCTHYNLLIRKRIFYG